VRDRRVVGRVVVTSHLGEFATFDRDLLELFADYLRQRIVDFNREWKQLTQIFSAAHVRRLLEAEDYVERYLKPRETKTAILFTDLSGFTRISEQVLKEPAKVGDLINRWGREVVEIVWDEGGVFDKMVGDCVIAFWGPPFDDLSPSEACRRAASAARRIRDLTRTLNEGHLVPELAGVSPPVGVATGLHWTRASVGLFGPDEDYTAFSSGMNNTARLQGVATCDEILCMEEFVAAYADDDAFGPPREAKVKNVAEPLKFRALR
jgi:class 3 adenylate cyclase